MTSTAKTAVVVFSGGMDSTTLLHYVIKELKRQVHALAFRYGQKHDLELEMAREQIRSLRDSGYSVRLTEADLSFLPALLAGSTALIDEDIEIPTLEEVVGQAQSITYVPFRNLIFLSIALSHAEAVGADRVYYGAQKQDEFSGYWDTTSYFLEQLNDVASLNRENQIRVLAPFIGLTKAEEIFLGLSLGVDYSKTWTSYEVINEEQRIAGYANATSRERIKAFAEVGRADPIKYDRDIDWNELIGQHKTTFNLSEIKGRVGEV